MQVSQEINVLNVELPSFDVKARVLKVLEFKGFTREKFFQKIGITYRNFTGEAQSRPLNSTAIGKILLEIPDLNPEWLLTGRGSMLKTEVSK